MARTPKQVQDEIKSSWARAEELGQKAIDAENEGDDEASSRYDQAAMDESQRLAMLQEEYTEQTNVVINADGTTNHDIEVGSHSFELPAKEKLKLAGKDPTNMTVEEQQAEVAQIEAVERQEAGEDLDQQIKEHIGNTLGIDVSNLSDDDLAKLANANREKLNQANYDDFDVISDPITVTLPDGTEIEIDESTEIKDARREKIETNIPTDLADTIKIKPGAGSGTGAGGDGGGTRSTPPPDDAGAGTGKKPADEVDGAGTIPAPDPAGQGLPDTAPPADSPSDQSRGAPPPPPPPPPARDDSETPPDPAGGGGATEPPDPADTGGGGGETTDETTPPPPDTGGGGAAPPPDPGTGGAQAEGIDPVPGTAPPTGAPEGPTTGNVPVEFIGSVPQADGSTIDIWVDADGNMYNGAGETINAQDAAAIANTFEEETGQTIDEWAAENVASSAHDGAATGDDSSETPPADEATSTDKDTDTSSDSDNETNDDSDTDDTDDTEDTDDTDDTEDGDSDDSADDEETETETETKADESSPDDEDYAPPGEGGDFVGTEEDLERMLNDPLWQWEWEADRNADINPDPMKDGVDRTGVAPDSQRHDLPGPDPVVDPGQEYRPTDQDPTAERIDNYTRNKGDIDWGDDGAPVYGGGAVPGDPVPLVADDLIDVTTDDAAGEEVAVTTDSPADLEPVELGSQIGTEAGAVDVPDRGGAGLDGEPGTDGRVDDDID